MFSIGETVLKYKLVIFCPTPSGADRQESLDVLEGR